MSIIHYVHLYMLSSHLHTTIIQPGGGGTGMPMLNRGGSKIWAKAKKKKVSRRRTTLKSGGSVLTD